MTKFKVIGLKKLNISLKKKELRITSSMNFLLKEVGLFMVKEVKESISGNRAEGPFRIQKRKVATGKFRGPIVDDTVDTGQFRDSVKKRNSFLSVEVFSPLKYALPLEFGTTKTKPRRHFRNSLKRNKPKILNEFSKEIKKLFR